MRKQFISMALSAVLAASAVMSGTGLFAQAETTSAENLSVQAEVEKDLLATAGYVMDQIQERITGEDYTISYNDYIQSMLCLKAGVQNGQVVTALTEALKSESSLVSDGANSLTIAAAVLFLNEADENPADFAGQDLAAMLYDTFMSEEDPNPYTYQYVNAAMLQSMKDTERLSAVLNKIRNDVESGYYVDNENGTGIDYWGVSADNNANIFSSFYIQNAFDSDAEITGALKDLSIQKSDVEYAGVSEMIQKSLSWTMAQCDESGAIVSWGSANPDSTGLALRWTSELAELEKAEQFYRATEQFKSETTKGAYTYSGRDSLFATVDMLWGLLAYERALDGYWIFDISADCEEEEQTTEETTAEAETTEKVTEKETAVLENETEKVTETVTETEKQSSDVPDTADHNMLFVFGAVACMAAGAAVSVRIRKNEGSK